MNVPWRRRRLTDGQKHARQAIEAAINYGGDPMGLPTLFGLAGYREEEVKLLFGRYCEAQANNPDLSPQSQEHLRVRARKLKEG